ncbi:MAG: histidine phosphatase family protein [Firmicutes bacterium]|nr:histidine phosphatase family protein [Bacillota bacterium]
MRIYLLRHGVTPYNKKKIIQGHLDIPLSEEGEAQAGETAGLLLTELEENGLHICRIFSSDLSRAARTAQILEEAMKEKGIALPAVIHRKDLREIYLNSWEGKSKKELLEDLEEDGTSLFQKWLERPAEVVPDGAESMPSFYYRSIDALSDIMDKLKNCDETGSVAVIYSHGGFLSMIRNYLNGREPASFIAFAHPNAGGMVFDVDLSCYRGGRFEPSMVTNFRQFPGDFDPVINLPDAAVV